MRKVYSIELITTPNRATFVPVSILKETEKAISLIIINTGAAIWLPRAALKQTTTTLNNGYESISFEIKGWFTRKMDQGLYKKLSAGAENISIYSSALGGK